MPDGRFFSTTKKGEVAEYKSDLHSSDRKQQKNAVKRVIAAMTVGKDVSSLFPDVVNCMQTEDMELKKLVYLYLINYAKTQPDLAIMAVNTFVKDTQDPNPLIRALAVRTMGCIRVDKITEYLCEPLARCLADQDPYVRKTAAVCVAKLHDIAPELVADRGFLDTLQELVGDANPMVVANTVASLREIGLARGEQALRVTPATLATLLRALNECTEWGQVYIMDALSAGPLPRDPRDAEALVERVLPRLSHANGAVVLAAVRLVLLASEAYADGEAAALVRKKLAPPLVTLLGGPPEVQYVALRATGLVAAKYPEALEQHVRSFFVRYTDPAYVKAEKLDLVVALATEQSLDQILLELKEYAAEVDVEFVRRAVRAVGAVAVKVAEGADRAVSVLLELIATRTPYVVQEAVVVARDVFRRYPDRYESVIAALCDCLDALDEPDAKAAMAWIVGEYSHRIDNAEDLAEQFLESFPEEPLQVQLALVTATVKLFLRAPTDKARALLQLVLTYATQESDSPDLRDRAYVYWRLLSADADKAKQVVLAPRPRIRGTAEPVDPALRDQLLAELGSLASVFRKPSSTFVTSGHVAVARADDLAAARAAAGTEDDEALAGAAPASPGAGGPWPGQDAASPPTPGSRPAPPPQMDLLGDLLDSPTAGGAPVAATTPTNGHGARGLPGSPLAPPSPVSSLDTLVVDPVKGKGLQVSGRLARSRGGPALLLTLHNGASAPIPPPLIQLNANVWGLVPEAQRVPLPGPLAPGASEGVAVPLRIDPASSVPPPPPPARAQLQLALKVAGPVDAVLYGAVPAPLLGVLREDGRVADAAFVEAWRSAPGPGAATDLRLTVADPDVAAAALESANVPVLARKAAGADSVLYASAHADAPPGRSTRALLELRFQPGIPGLRVTYKSPSGDLALAQLFFDQIQDVLSG